VWRCGTVVEGVERWRVLAVEIAMSRYYLYLSRSRLAVEKKMPCAEQDAFLLLLWLLAL
jgi:hypothetical protein